MITVASVAAAAAARLRDAGLPPSDARQDAAVLARGVLGWTLADWLSQSHQPAPAGFPSTFDALVARRAAREPVAYLLGEKEFYGRRFEVTADTLIPRPETEGLVEITLLWIRRRVATRPGPISLVDVGTGTGCIAITLALECAPVRMQLTATDISAAALAVATANASRLNAPAIDFRLGHLLAKAALPIDVVVSNPPYVSRLDRDAMQDDVLRYEPARALFGGDSGLDVIAELIPEARRAIAPGGVLLMEVGVGQADRVTAWLESAGFVAPEQHPDLQGIARVVVGHAPVSAAWPGL